MKDGDQREKLPSGKDKKNPKPDSPWQKWKRRIFPLLRLVVIAYICICTLLYFLQTYMIYQPRDHLRVPYQYQNGKKTLPSWYKNREEITLTTEDNVKIWAWYIPASRPRGTVLFCHGNAGNLTWRDKTIAFFHSLSLNVLIFDYRGYGKSEGSPTEKGTYLDGEAAWNYLIEKKGAKAEEILIGGRSLGGGIATWLALKKKPKALLLDSTFTSIPDVASEIYFFLPVSFLARVRYPNLARISQIKCPKLITHGRRDEIIPFHHGKRLYEKASPPREFLATHKRHNDWPGRSYEKKVKDFVRRYFQKKGGEGKKEKGKEKK